MTWAEWPDDPYDGAPHPDRSNPADHDDIHPVAWQERCYRHSAAMDETLEDYEPVKENQ